MKASISRIKVDIIGNSSVTYVERTALFGLVRWWVRQSATKLKDDLYIETDWTIERIFLNGEELSRGSEDIINNDKSI